MSSVSKHEHCDRMDQELEHLRRMVRDLKLEVQGRHRRRNLKDHAEGLTSVGGSHREASRQSGSHRSREYMDGDSVSPERRRP
nr:hypothetical protein CFP56_32744 [Quercus suber]